MIMSVDELKSYIDTTEKYSVLESKLQALELLIRKYSNNNFQDRNRRFVSAVSTEHGILCASSLIAVGDTVQISKSKFNDGLYVITNIDIDNGYMMVD